MRRNSSLFSYILSSLLFAFHLFRCRLLASLHLHLSFILSSPVCSLLPLSSLLFFLSSLIFAFQLFPCRLLASLFFSSLSFSCLLFFLFSHLFYSLSTSSLVVSSFLFTFISLLFSSPLYSLGQSLPESQSRSELLTCMVVNRKRACPQQAKHMQASPERERSLPSVRWSRSSPVRFQLN